MKRKITIQTEIEVSFDENSQEFKDLFENYNNHFHECDLETFSENIALIIAHEGVKQNIEGIGAVLINGKPQKTESGEIINHFINVEGHFYHSGEVVFEVAENEQL